MYGEVLATKLAGVLAYSLHLDKFILEGDSALVVLALQNPALSVAWHIEQIIHDTLASFQVSFLWEQERSTEVQTSAPIMWLIGPWQGLS